MILKSFADVISLSVLQVRNTSLKQAIYIIVISINIVDNIFSDLYV